MYYPYFVLLTGFTVFALHNSEIHKKDTIVSVQQVFLYTHIYIYTYIYTQHRRGVGKVRPLYSLEKLYRG